MDTATFRVTSSAFKEGEHIPDKYANSGKNVNPDLIIENVPANTKSLAIMVDDPDAPNETFIHWIVKNIKPDIKNVAENSVPGDLVKNSFGVKEYGGPAPPSGTHRYFFHVYALPIEKLESETLDEFKQDIKKIKIAEATLMGLYTKKDK
jgi:Raf kinase inhibitor-like YbhB/YbcL family protein